MTTATRWRQSGQAGLLLLLCLSTVGCLQFRYTRTHTEEPVPAERLQVLRPGADDLASCLAALGAPHFVWEYQGEGAAIGYVAGDSHDWSVRVSYSVDSLRNVSFEYGAGDLALSGVVLWFDAELGLLEWRRGAMRALLAERQRAAPVDDSSDG